MLFDTGILSGSVGNLRLFTLILGAVVVGLTTDSYHKGEDYEDFFFWTAVVLLIGSTILTVAGVLGITREAVFVNKADAGFHLIGGLVFLVASVLMLISVFDHGNGPTTGKYIQRIATGAIGLVNALIYCSLGWNTCRTN